MTDTRPRADVRVVEHAADLPRAEWDALARPQDVYLTCRWLDVVERTAGVPMTYFTVHRDGRLVAAMPGAAVHAGVPWAFGRADVVIGKSAGEDLPGAVALRERLPEDLATGIMPSLAIGGRHVGTTRALLHPDATPDDVDALLDAAEAHARAVGMCSVGMLFVDETEAMLTGRLEARGYASCVTGTFSYLPVPGGGFTGYLGTLRRNRRTSVRAERRRLREAGAVTRIERLDEVDLGRLAELEAALLHKYGIAAEPAQLRPLLEQVGACFGDDAFVMTLRADGAIRGFALVLRSGRHWTTRQTGYDYDYQHRTRLPLYFEVLYYALVEAAGDAGVEVIHYGLGSAEAKRSRGCASTEQRTYLLPLSGSGG